MINFVLFSKSLNPAPIEATGTASSEDLALLQETDETGVVVLTDDDGEVSGETHMVAGSRIELRPTHNVRVTLTGNIVALSDLPTEPYDLFVDMGEPVGLLPVSETEFELTDPGQYTVVVRPVFPYAEERHSVAIE